MTNHESQDKPPYDAVQFEAERKARANEFEQLVKSLATIDASYEFDEDDDINLGAHFELSRGKRQVDVKYEERSWGTYERASRMQITEPWLETVGEDGLRRRARLSRYILYRVNREVDIENLIQFDEADLPEPSEGLEEMARNWVKGVETWRLELSLDPNYRPSELIRVWQGITVEAKLPKGPNYRTERVASTDDPLRQISHLDIRRKLGEPTGLVPYTIEKHDEIVKLLKRIKSRRMKAQPLDSDFDENFLSDI